MRPLIVMAALLLAGCQSTPGAPADARPQGSATTPAQNPETAPDAPVCGPSRAMLGHLFQTYGEEPIWMGLSKDGPLTVIAQNRETGTWSQLAMSPDGVACLLFTGEGARSLVGEGPSA